METKILLIDPEHPETELIAEAAGLIRRGGTVAFPTETVYGLGANGLDPEAVERIFQAKGRPRSNPLILHIASLDQGRHLVAEWPPAAELLARTFLPGPLTLILPRSPQVPDQVTAGLPNVALRFPANQVALALIAASGVPIAAPSANLSGRPSPTTAEHVQSDLAGKIDLILDGGPARVGVESTILSLVGERPLLLRPGAITREQLEQVLEIRIEVHRGILQAQPDMSGEQQAAAPCPGLFFKHYAPRARALMVTGKPEYQGEKVRSYLATNHGRRIAVLGTEDNAACYRSEHFPALTYLEILGAREHPEQLTSHLFGALRRCDQARVEQILVETIPTTGIGLAYMNRLCRATENRTI